MAVQRVKRLTLTGAVTPFEFPSYGGRYLVKNFSDSDIYISFEATVDPSTSIKIASDMAQLCEINERFGASGQEKAKTVYISGTGEVEVQQLWF